VGTPLLESVREDQIEAVRSFDLLHLVHHRHGHRGTIVPEVTPAAVLEPPSYAARSTGPRPPPPSEPDRQVATGLGRSQDGET
jgi:hypothetical protein